MITVKITACDGTCDLLILANVRGAKLFPAMPKRKREATYKQLFSEDRVAVIATKLIIAADFIKPSWLNTSVKGLLLTFSSWNG